jgi:glycosyltransferase involved in cell wall biosynthesis
LPVSILLLTLNEEKNLPICLDALSWCDDVVVIDSNSTDRTVELAGKHGARVFRRPFDNFAAQRNYGLQDIPFKHEWIFHLDADEIITDELRSEMEQSILHTPYDAFRIPSKMMLFGKWLRYSGMYPAYQVRLTRHPSFTFRQVGHGQREDIDQSRIGTLKSPYLHYSFSKGMTDWFERHNRYSSMEAEESLRHLASGSIDWNGLLSHNTTRRRRALKEFSFRLPFRPLARFIYMYFLRLGFLDGRAGLTYCSLLSIYEYMILVKIKEIQGRGKNLQA